MLFAGNQQDHQRLIVLQRMIAATELPWVNKPWVFQLNSTSHRQAVISVTPVRVENWTSRLILLRSRVSVHEQDHWIMWRHRMWRMHLWRVCVRMWSRVTQESADCEVSQQNVNLWKIRGHRRAKVDHRWSLQFLTLLSCSSENICYEWICCSAFVFSLKKLHRNLWSQICPNKSYCDLLENCLNKCYCDLLEYSYHIYDDWRVY